MYVDMDILDQECVRLACLMTERGMEQLTLPDTRSEEEAGADLEEEFGAELAKSFTRIAAAGSDQECILPSMLMTMASKLSCLATELSMRSDRYAVEVIRSLGCQ